MLPPDPLIRAHDLAVLMQRVGSALWQAQEIEAAIAAYVVIRLKASPGVGAERGAELKADAERRTFGSLLKELTKAGLLSRELSSQLDRVLAERNWLVHHARRESRGILSDRALYDATSQRLEKLADDAGALLRQIAFEVRQSAISMGVDGAEIEREAARLRHQWGLAES